MISFKFKVGDLVCHIADKNCFHCGIILKQKTCFDMGDETIQMNIKRICSSEELKDQPVYDIFWFKLKCYLDYPEYALKPFGDMDD